MSGVSGIAVSWCTMTSGRAVATASATWSGSSASATTGTAPSPDSSSRLDALRVIPCTSWPAATSRGTSCLPIAPDAPATNTLIVITSVSDACTDQDATAAPAVTPPAFRIIG